MDDPEGFDRYLRVRYLFSDKNPTSVVTTTIGTGIYDNMKILITHLKTYKIPIKNIKKLTLEDYFSSNSDSLKKCLDAPIFPDLVELVISDKVTYSYGTKVIPLHLVDFLEANNFKRLSLKGFDDRLDNLEDLVKLIKKRFNTSTGDNSCDILRFSECIFTKLPSWILSLKSLESLIIENCYLLNTLPKDIFTQSPEHLKYIEILGKNQLKGLTREDVMNIKSKDLSHIRINIGDYDGSYDQDNVSYWELRLIFESNISFTDLSGGLYTSRFFCNMDCKGMRFVDGTLNDVYAYMDTYSLSWNTDRLKTFKFESIPEHKCKKSSELLEMLRNDLQEYIQPPGISKVSYC